MTGPGEPPTAYDRDRNYIDGRWTPPEHSRWLGVENPFTADIIGRAPLSGAGDAAVAVAAASAAFDDWSQRPGAERSEYLMAMYDGLLAHLDLLAVTWTHEVGIPITLARQSAAGLAVTTLRHMAELASLGLPEIAYQGTVVAHRPIGVVAAITPWNYPLSQLVIKTATALAAGCTVVAKPSEIAPLCAYQFADIIAAAGLPAGVFNLVGGDGPTVGAALVGDPRVRAVSFTGSTATGRRIMVLAASNITRVCLELGGKSASIVLDEEILEQAVQSTVASCLRNSGQTCTALTRLVVPHRLADRAVDIAAASMSQAVIGDPMDPATTVGPLISAVQLERVQGFIEQAKSDGICMAMQREVPQGPGHFVGPTLFRHVDPDSSLAQQEVFGPVLAVIEVEESELVDVANRSRYGLAAAVWADDPVRALAVAKGVEAGSITVNGAPFDGTAPYGGLKHSGLGRELGSAGLHEFLEPQTIFVAPPAELPSTALEPATGGEAP